MPDKEPALRSGHPRLPWTIACIAGLALMAGCGQAGKPQIVSGVPAQVDYKFSQKEYDPSNPPLWPKVFYLGLEQCEADIAKAKDGEDATAPNFDPRTHQYGDGCFVSRVEVPQTVFDEHNEGDVITFNGPVGEPIGRVEG